MPFVGHPDNILIVGGKPFENTFLPQALFGVRFLTTTRTTPIIQQIMEAMEAVLLSKITPAQRMNFLTGEPSKVVIVDAEPDEEPKANYKRYLITLFPMPDSLEEQPRIGGRVERFYKIGVACWRKAPRSGRNRIFSDTNDSTTGVGVFEFVNLVMDALRNNTLSGLVNLTAGKQFSTPEVQDTGDDFLERIDFTYNTEVLSTVDDDGVA